MPDVRRRVRGEPGVESHGGYGFCAIATLCILDACHLVDLDALDAWVARRQTNIEGGYQGRASKFDGCMLQLLAGRHGAIVRTCRRGDPHHVRGTVWRTVAARGFNRISPRGDAYPGNRGPDQTPAVHLVVRPGADGGLRDKPGKGRDYYHTVLRARRAYRRRSTRTAPPRQPSPGSPANLLPRTHPAFNCRPERTSRMLDQNAGLPDRP